MAMVLATPVWEVVTLLPVEVQFPPPAVRATQTVPSADGRRRMLLVAVGDSNCRVVVLDPVVAVSLVVASPCKVRGNGEGEMVPTVRVPLDWVMLLTVRVPPMVVLPLPAT